MQKKNRSRMNPEVGETLLEFFMRRIEDDKSVANIISTLAIINGCIINHPGSKNNEIFDFGNFFIANGYEDFTRKERQKAFGGNEAFILNKYYEIAEKIERQEILEAIEDLSFAERYEALTLTDKIFKIKGSKIVTLSTEDGPIEFNYEKTLKSNEIAPLKNEFFSYMAYAIKLGNAEIVVRTKKSSGRPEIFGISIEDSVWKPLRVYEFMEASDSLDLDARYTEIVR